MTNKPNTFYRLFSVLFFLAIAYPGIASITNNPEVSLEKRWLAKLPDLPSDFESLRKFPNLFERYFRDHMGSRNWLVKQYSRALLSLNTSPKNRVVLGKNNWLFYADERTIQDYQNTELFTEEQLQIWGDSLVARHNALAERGIDYLFVIAPNKHTIYGEYLPDYIIKKQELSRYDQFTDYLEKNTDVNFLDLRPALLAAKKHDLLYWERDTHWNRVGAAVAQKALASKLIEMGYSIKLVASDYKNWRQTHKRDQDLVGSLGGVVEIETQGRSYDLNDLPCKKSDSGDQTWGKDNKRSTHVRTSICPSQQKNLVMFRDSFSIAMTPFLSNYFYEAKYLWSLPDEKTFIHFINPDTDIVIEERVERKLRYLPGPHTWTMNLDKLDHDTPPSSSFADNQTI